MADDTYVGAVGFEIFMDTNLDLTGAASVAIRYRKPDNTDGEWAAAVYQKDGEWGIRYITIADDLDQAGEWDLQVEVNGFSGYTGPSTKAVLQVGRPLPGA
jgi:hypothetical protein